MELGHLDVWFCTVVLFCLSQAGKRGGQRQKVYADTCANCLSSTTNQMIGRVCKFLLVWEPQELEVFEVEDR